MFIIESIPKGFFHHKLWIRNLWQNLTSKFAHKLDNSVIRYKETKSYGTSPKASSILAKSEFRHKISLRDCYKTWPQWRLKFWTWKLFFHSRLLLAIHPYTSVTRLGDIWKFLVPNFLTKVAQFLGDSLGFFKKHNFYLNKLLQLFELFEQIWGK